jgi:transposase-like protein
VGSEGNQDPMLPDAAALPGAESKVCPKCGSGRTPVTAHVTEDDHHLSLFRCETCGFRFSRLTSAES